MEKFPPDSITVIIHAIDFFFLFLLKDELLRENIRRQTLASDGACALKTHFYFNAFNVICLIYRGALAQGYNTARAHGTSHRVSFPVGSRSHHLFTFIIGDFKCFISIIIIIISMVGMLCKMKHGNRTAVQNSAELSNCSFICICHLIWLLLRHYGSVITAAFIWGSNYHKSKRQRKQEDICSTPLALNRGHIAAFLSSKQSKDLQSLQQEGKKNRERI